MPDYSKGKVYRLVTGSGMEYIGSTTQTLSKRKTGHKRDYENWQNGERNYITSFKLFDEGEVDIILIENYACANIEELHQRERYWIEKSKKCVNKNLPSHTRTHEDILKRSREYQATPKRKEYAKQYKEDNKTHIQQYFLNYAEDNREKLLQYYKDRYEIKKEEIRAYQNEKIKCECGAVVGRINIQRHKRSKIHLENIDLKK